MKANIAKYHHNYKNNLSDYKLNKKVESTQKKKAKLSTDHSPNFCFSSSRSSTDSSIPKCIVCNEIDELKNLHAAGALHATKTKLKADHDTRQTEKWRHMATTIGDSRLASRWSIGDLRVDSSFYHKRCYTEWYNDFMKKNNEKKQGGLDIPQIRATAWDKVVAFMDEAKDNSDGFDIHDPQDMHLDFLSKYSIKSVEISHVLDKTCLKKRQAMKSSKIRRHEPFVKNLFESYSVSFVSHQKAGLDPSGQLLFQLERTYLNGKTCLMVT